MSDDKKFAQLIESASLKATPWKNGGGETREIAIHPLGSSLEKSDFTWRLSTADVNVSGPFSQYPDFERLLTVVRGEELVLEFPDMRKILRPGKVLLFNGEEEVSAIVKNPVGDLGLIYDPDMVLAKMTLVELRNRPRSFSLSSPTVFLYVVHGELSASLYPGEMEFTLHAGDSLRIGDHKDERVVFLDPGSGETVVAAIEIAEVEVKVS